MKWFCRNKWLVWGLLLLLPACTNQFKAWEKQAPPDQADIFHSMLNLEDEALVFNCGISYKERYFSGLLAFKRHKDTVNVGFAGKTGGTIFNVKLTPKKMIKIFCVKQLNNPIVLPILEKDLRLLADHFYPIQDVSWYKSPDHSSLILEKKVRGKRIQFFYPVGRDYPEMMQRSTRRKAKVQVNVVERGSKNAPISLKLQHLNFDLTWSLMQIRR